MTDEQKALSRQGKRMTTPKADIRRMADAVLPLNIMANSEGFITVTDANGYFVVCLAPIQTAAIARAIAVATEPPRSASGVRSDSGERE
jgi:hypothetical protein